MELDNKYYNIVIERKRIKNIYFRIKDDSIYVTCSRLVPEREIKKLLEKNKKSLERMAKKDKARHKDDFKVLFLGSEMPPRSICFLPVLILPGFSIVKDSSSIFITIPCGI